MSIKISESFSLYESDFIVMSGLSRKTSESYMNTKLLLIRYMGDLTVNDITFENIRDWKNHLSETQCPNTVRNNIINLRMVLRFLIRRSEPVLSYELIPVPKREKHLIHYLTDEEAHNFIKEAGKLSHGYSRMHRLRNVAIITLLYATGLRNSELCALNRDSIKNRSFTVVGKSKEPRIVFINSEAEQAINEYLEARSDPNKALFISHQTGNRIKTSGLRQVFADICRRSDFKDVHPHTIRHSFATYMLSKEVDLRYIGDLMGHQDLNTTKIYSHYSCPQLRRIYEKAFK